MGYGAIGDAAGDAVGDAVGNAAELLADTPEEEEEEEEEDDREEAAGKYAAFVEDAATGDEAMEGPGEEEIDPAEVERCSVDGNSPEEDVGSEDTTAVGSDPTGNNSLEPSPYLCP